MKRDQLHVGGRAAVQSKQLQVSSWYSVKSETSFSSGIERIKNFNFIVILVAGPQRRSGRVTRQSSK